MAQYIFVKTRKPGQSASLFKKLEHICNVLTPNEIKGKTQNTVKNWPNDPTAFFAVQNSVEQEHIKKETMLIGRLQASSQNKVDGYSTDADGSYGVIQNEVTQTCFFSDQLASRTLWYYFDDDTLIISTSQRAIVALKGSFNLNDEAIACFLSSGYQGPFISWDREMEQVHPHLIYHLDIATWCLDSRKKTGLELPPSGSIKTKDFLEVFKQQVTSSLDEIINSAPEGQVLMPLSGGLDSRLLFTLSHQAGLDKKIDIVNWGVTSPPRVFDDKAAAHRIANFYNKNLLSVFLPSEIDAFDDLLDMFVSASEGRLEHLNAYTDHFKMWQEFFDNNYRFIVRGDIPFTEGLELNERRARTDIGLEILSDYANKHEFPFGKLLAIQRQYEVKRLDNESLIRWRDRLFVDFCIPVEISAYSDIVSGYVENRSPMMNWSLFKLYMGIPDKDKGDKLHIKSLCHKYDRSKVPTHASSSLRAVKSYFQNAKAKNYLLHKLNLHKKSEHFSPELIDSLIESISNQHFDSTIAKKTFSFNNTKAWISDHLPPLLKAYLKSKRVKNISAITIAYRLILIEKIIAMYQLDAKELKESH